MSTAMVETLDQIAGIALPWQNNIFFGHTAVISFLKEMCKEGRLHHALLFKGQRGVGKTTLAFHFAWSILKYRGEKFSHPDAFCSVWDSIMKRAGYPALLYVSHNYDLKVQKFHAVITIEEVRRINRYLQQTAANNEWRVIIIDPVEDMNRNASNALLKILEEPPKKTIFILISHSPGKLLPTIRSRCLSVSFGDLNKEEIKKILFFVGQSVGFKYTNQQTDLLIKESHGSIRKAFIIFMLRGIHITEKLDEIIETPILPISEVYRLVTKVSEHNSILAFDFLFSSLMERVSKKALDAAFRGNLSKAAQLACLWQQIQREKEEVKTYNLDKKQFALVWLQKIHIFLHQNQDS